MAVQRELIDAESGQKFSSLELLVGEAQVAPGGAPLIEVTQQNDSADVPIQDNAVTVISTLSGITIPDPPSGVTMRVLLQAFTTIILDRSANPTAFARIFLDLYQDGVPLGAAADGTTGILEFANEPLPSVSQESRCFAMHIWTPNLEPGSYDFSFRSAASTVAPQAGDGTAVVRTVFSVAVVPVPSGG